MTAEDTHSPSIDAYIERFPPEIRALLTRIRDLIRAAAPEATETFAYGMPTFFLNGNLIHFAAFQHHIGVYPTPSGTAAFASELAPYKHAKGSIQFPLSAPLPWELLDRIVRFRVEENRAKKPRKK